MHTYESLFRQFKSQNANSIFSHFYPVDGDYNEPYREIARKTSDGETAWEFQQPRFIEKYKNSPLPKLKNYLNYTFVRLVFLENAEKGYFCHSNDGAYISFNTGLQDPFGGDLLLIFQKYKPKTDAVAPLAPRPDWVYKFCCTPTESKYRSLFGIAIPKIAYYSEDSRDFIFNTSYSLDKEAFAHLFDRAKERSGMPNASDEVIKNYLRGAIENLIPKIKRNYKVAIPVYYVEDKRMQLLLPFVSASNDETSCFLIERDDENSAYHLKTIFDLDQAYFSARLITRPDRDWLNP